MRAGSLYLARCRASHRPPTKCAAEKADYTLRIATGLVELAPDHIVSTTLYNGQFPGPLLRFKEGQQVVVDIHNDTDTPELVHWHGQMIPSDVDGASEEGTPFVPAHGMRRIAFVPKPSGFRFYHTHVVAGGDLNRGTYTGQAGPVYIEPKTNPGAYDREIFLVMKEFAPSFSRGGDMAMDVLAGAPIKALQTDGEGRRRGSAGEDQGLRGRLRAVRHQWPDARPWRAHPREAGRARAVPRAQCERDRNPQSRSARPSSSAIVALDGNPVPTQADVPVLWLGTAERISALVEMNHPGVWVMGDLADDDRRHGMGIVVEYAGQKGKPQWIKPKPFRWDYTQFGKANAVPASPDETIEITIVKHNGALNGFNQWTLNGEAFSMETMKPMYTVHEGRRYRLKFRNASDDIHPLHLHRHSFELTRIGGKPTAGVIKDVVMLGGFQEAGIRLRRRQSGADALPLSPAAAHGFRVHGALQLCVGDRGIA